MPATTGGADHVKRALLMPGGRPDRSTWARGAPPTGRQVKRVLGPAWLVPDGDGWRPASGRVPDGVLDERSAYVVLAEQIAAREQEVEAEAHRVVATFADAAERWLHHLEHVKRVKPSTLADYRSLLAHPDTPARKRGSARCADHACSDSGRSARSRRRTSAATSRAWTRTRRSVRARSTSTARCSPA